VAGDVGSELTYVAVIRDHQKKRKLLFEDGLEAVADPAISDGAIVYNPKPMDPDENLKVLKQAW
jgi:alcohol dehydrogenase class IV